MVKPHYNRIERQCIINDTWIGAQLNLKLRILIVARDISESSILPFWLAKKIVVRTFNRSIKTVWREDLNKIDLTRYKNLNQ